MIASSALLPIKRGDEVWRQGLSPRLSAQSSCTRNSARTAAAVAARNIAAQIKGEQPASRKAFGDIPAVCVMDAGNNGVIILADKMLPPRKHGVLIPGPQAHAMKLAFEKYFLWKICHGYIGLP
jgi:hypothetical protein